MLKKIFLLLFVLVNLSCQASILDWRLIKSAALFYPSIAYNAIIYGKAFNFTRIPLSDNKKRSLVLGSIPRKPKHIGHIKQACNVPQAAKIAIFSLNRTFERDWAGLSDLVKKDGTICLFLYPTTDYSSPSFIDILRAVRDLENSDYLGLDVVYVHCKAGRGRSATIIAAYIMHVFYKQKTIMSVQEVENYLKSIRPNVSLNKEQKAQLAVFSQQLQQTGSLEDLCLLYHNDIAARDFELNDKK